MPKCTIGRRHRKERSPQFSLSDLFRLSVMSRLFHPRSFSELLRTRGPRAGKLLSNLYDGLVRQLVRPLAADTESFADLRRPETFDGEHRRVDGTLRQSRQ